jgi:hypothetical protein
MTLASDVVITGMFLDALFVLLYNFRVCKLHMISSHLGDMNAAH